MQKGSEMSEECIQKCFDCYKYCLETKSYCLDKGGKHVDSSHLITLSDCAEVCREAVHFMIKKSDLSEDMCQICAESCRRCAVSCDEFFEDERMKSCARICKGCEESCQTYENK